MKNQSNKEQSTGRLIAGLIIAVAGLLFLFNNFNLLSPRLEHYIFDWRTLIIAIGALNLLFSNNRTGGLVMITIGLIFWIPDIFVMPIRTAKLVWPMALIAVGLYLITKRRERRFGSRFWEERIAFHQSARNQEETASGDPISADEYIDDIAIFGGGSRIVSSKNFKGGKLTAIFGGSTIKLHHARLAPGNHALDVFFMFGGSELIVPSDWIIRVDVVSIFGGFSDKRYVHKQDEINEATTSVLSIKGLVLFGGGELKSY